MRIFECSLLVMGCVLLSASNAASADTCEPSWASTFADSLVIGQVATAIAFDDGTGEALYIGGDLTAAGDQLVNNIAKWDGESWSALGDGLDDIVRDMAVFDDGTGPALYVVGDFKNSGDVPVNYIAKWDGESWTSVSNGTDGRLYAITVYDDGNGEDLYIGGYFARAGGVQTSRIARWDGAAWTAVGDGGTSGTDQVRSLAVANFGDGDVLFVGGRFSRMGDANANNLACWDGENWSAVGSGTNGYVHALAAFDDGTGPGIYAAGIFTVAGGEPTNRIVRWDGEQFTRLNNGLSDNAWALATYDDGTGTALYAAGEFRNPGDYIAKWDGSEWYPLDEGLNNRVYGLRAWPSRSSLIVAGTFTQTESQPSRRIAEWRSDANPIDILQQPEGANASSGDTVVLEVVADSAEPVTYQWRRDGIEMEGATESQLVFQRVTEKDAGLYDAVISNTCLQVVSDAAQLNVEPAGNIADLNSDGVVDVSDLLTLLSAWGECPGRAVCIADLNGDATVDVSDLLILLAAWG